MTEVVNKYRIQCNNDETFITDYLYEPPTTCPNGHNVVADETTIIDTISSDVVKLRDDIGTTQGFYRGNGYEMDIVGPTGTVTDFEVSFDYRVLVYAITLHCGEDNVGDNVTFCTAPNTVLGITTTETVGPTGSTVLDVNSTVTDNIKYGWCISLVDGETTERLGEVVSYDKNSQTVTTNGGPTGTFPPGSLVSITVPRLVNIPLTAPGYLPFGLASVGGSEVPAGTKGLVHYTNNDGQSKKFGFTVEIRY